MRDLKMYSKYQGAWQKNKITINNARVLINMLEDSKKHKKEIHTLFIDICKAYDSVEHWGIEQICYKYGLNQDFVEIIMSLLQNTNVKIITQYGYSERINVGKGVRQGDVISPTLFIIWLNPLLEHLEKSQLGYVCDKSNIKLPILAFADDLLIADVLRKNFDIIFGKVVAYCSYYHMEISPTKSGYMYQNTNDSVPPVVYKNKEIKVVSKDKTYKYLGCEFNAELDWEVQKNILKDSTIKHVKFLCSRRITSKQKVAVINLITYTKITYRMQAIKFSKEWLNNLDTEIANILLNSAGFPKTADKEMLWTKVKDGGWGLNKLSTLQKATTINTNLTYALNIEGINRDLLLEKINNTDLEDVAEKSEDSLNCFLWTLNELDLRIVNKDKLPEPTNHINIIKDNKLNAKTGDGYVFTDGSLAKKEGKAGAGIFFFKGCKTNKAFNVPNCTSSLEAELHAIAYVTGLNFLNKSIKIVIDNIGAIEIIKNFNKLNNNAILKIKYRSVIRQICHDIAVRKASGWDTEFEHIFSHVEKKRKSKDKKLVDRVIDREKELGDLWNTFTKGNEKADKLAAKGRESEESIVISNKWRDDFVIIKNDVIIEDNIYKKIINDYIDIEKEKYHEKPKRGMGWRCDNTDIKRTVAVTAPYVKFNNHLHDFVFKSRQMTLQNKNRLFSYSKTNSREREYMKEVYTDNLCVLCNENTVDDRLHWRRCEYSKVEWMEMEKEIEEIIEGAGGTNVKLWFGNKEEIDIDADNTELNITTFDKQLGNLFYIPKKVCRYLGNCGVNNPEKTLKDINKKHVKRAYRIYKNRVKEQAIILQLEEKKRECKEKQRKEKKEKERKRKEREKEEKAIKKRKNNIIINNIADKSTIPDVEVNEQENIIKNKDINTGIITEIKHSKKKYVIKFSGIKKIFKSKTDNNNTNNKITINTEYKTIKRKTPQENHSNKRRKIESYNPP